VADKEDTRKLLHTINTAVSDEAVREEDLNDLFEAMWSQLQEALNKLPLPDQTVQAKRTTEDMVAEILEITRAETNKRKKTDVLDQYIPFLNNLLPQLYNALNPQFGMPAPGTPMLRGIVALGIPGAAEPAPVPPAPDFSNLSAATAPPRPAPVPTAMADPKAK
jgi:hypothetical protein